MTELSAAAKATGSLQDQQPLAGLEWVYPENHPDEVIPLGQEGGLARTATGELVGIKNACYLLPADRDRSGVYPAQTYPLPALPGNTSRSSKKQSTKVGLELELGVFDADGNPYPVRDDKGEPISTALEALIGPHPELFAHTAEVETEPATSALAATRNLKMVVQQLMKALPTGAQLDPAAAWMDEIPEAKHMTQHPYLAVNVERIGGYIFNFVGHSLHEHHDVAPEHILTVARYVQLMAPYLSAGLLAAPFMYGQLTPRLSEIYADHADVDLLKEVEQSGADPYWRSVRYPTRYYSSDGGGVAAITQDSIGDYLHFSDLANRDGSTNSIARGHGRHRDVRTRYDLEPGRVELCFKDDPLGRMETIQAYLELSRAVIRSLSELAEQGDTAIEQLHQALPELLGTDPNPTEMGPLFERTHRNSLLIAKNGPGIYVEDATGKQLPVSYLVEKIMSWAAEQGHRLPTAAIHTIRRSLGSPAPKHLGVDRYYDPATGGIGTPADHMIAEAIALQDSGLSDREVLRHSTKRRMQSFADYILRAA